MEQRREWCLCLQWVEQHELAAVAGMECVSVSGVLAPSPA